MKGISKVEALRSQNLMSARDSLKKPTLICLDGIKCSQRVVKLNRH